MASLRRAWSAYWQHKLPGAGADDNQREIDALAHQIFMCKRLARVAAERAIRELRLLEQQLQRGVQ